MRDCNKVKNVSPVTRLCPTCEKTVNGGQSDRVRQDTVTRQNQARASALDQNRDLNVSLSPTNSNPGSNPAPSMAPPQNNLINFPNVSSSSNSSITPPKMNMASLQNTYNQMLAGGGAGSPQDRIMTDMYGMLLNVLSKQSENDAIKHEVKDHAHRIRELEAKVGDPSDVSEKLGLAVRNLPLPSLGQSEVENVRAALYEIRAPGVEVDRDVTKAVRVGVKDDYLGTVKVEMLNDAARASIMKNKKNLENHQNPAMKNLIIKNLKSEDQMRMENFARDVLQILPGGDNYFVAGNGRLRQKDLPQAHHPYPHRVQAHGLNPYPHRIQAHTPAGPHSAAPYQAGHHHYQGGQYARHQVDNYQHRASLSHQSAGAHGQAGQVQQQHQHPHPPNQYSHSYAQQVRKQGVQAAAQTTHVQPTNPLDLIDPFQNYPPNPAPVTAPAVALPGGNPAYNVALSHHQGGLRGEQEAVNDIAVTQGQ